MANPFANLAIWMRECGFACDNASVRVPANPPLTHNRLLLLGGSHEDGEHRVDKLRCWQLSGGIPPNAEDMRADSTLGVCIASRGEWFTFTETIESLCFDNA